MGALSVDIVSTMNELKDSGETCLLVALPCFTICSNIWKMLECIIVMILFTFGAYTQILMQGMLTNYNSGPGLRKRYIMIIRLIIM